METSEKLRILADSAKYDVSCASSGSSRGGRRDGVGLTNGWGVCHAFAADGRCVSLLKVLLSNVCCYDCRYCVNRSSADVPRATFEPDELCRIVMAFYVRNYIEGLFLSSAVCGSPDATMERLLETVTLLRKKYGFNGYIHLKAIPGCDAALLDRAARVADRISVNMELPSRSSLKMLCPDKSSENIVAPMRQLAALDRARAERQIEQNVLPAGQSTQMIVGASRDADGQILRLSERLYKGLRMRRVYYSAYMPTGDARLPQKPPNLIRENRLYQADWLIRFYGYTAQELLAPQEDLPQDVDPKCAWALAHPEQFPVEINTADPLMLLRVPGIGRMSVMRILQARRVCTLRYEDLKRMRVVLRRAAHFIVCDGKYYGAGLHPELLRLRLAAPAYAKTQPMQQMLFDGTALVAFSGEL